MKKLIIPAMTLILLFCMISRDSNAAANRFDTSALATEQIKATQLVTEIPIIEALGPLAPVALSPFFGLTCLSATSILSTKGVIPENKFLTDNQALNNPLVFTVFLLLTLATSIPRFTTVTKTFAQAADHLETYAGIISYAVVFLLAVPDAPETAASANLVYTAGIISVTRQTLLIAAFAINIFVINSVKYFFELLVWISPVPFIDAAFEIANKTVVAALAIIYAFNPALALVINIVLFTICLTIFGWTTRRVRYLKTMIIEPLIMGLRKNPKPHARLALRLTKHIAAQPIAKVFPLRRIGKIKKKDLALLYIKDNNLVLLSPRFLRSPKTAQILRSDYQITIESAILSNILILADSRGKTKYKLAFSHSYDKQTEQLKEMLTPPETLEQPTQPDTEIPYNDQ